MGTTPTFTLQLFSEPETASLEQRVPATVAAPQAERDRAEWLACQETWRPHPSRRPTSAHEPYSLAWYEDIEHRRYSRHGHWIPKFFEFNRHQGDQVLCLGDGLGTDWVQFALNGANVHYCAPALEPLSAVRRNFELRSLDGNFHRGPYHELPIASDSKDVVCLSAMSKPIQPLAPVIDEIFRVLKPGGKLLAALPAKYSAGFWKSFWFPWTRLFVNRPEDEALYSARRVKRLFAAFSEPRVHKRHLRRSDIPHLWRWMLLPALERMMGRYLVIKTFKPVAASLSFRAAAEEKALTVTSNAA